MKKSTTIKKLTAISLAIITVLFTFCIGAYAVKENFTGADVYIGSKVKHYDSISEAWASATTSKCDAKIVLLEDWTANENGYFGSGKGFKNGAISLSSCFSSITLDLNGKTINRGLNSATSNGQVFHLSNSKLLTVTDSSEEKTGMITGGFNKGKGGAFFVSCTNLKVENVTIADNTCTERGGAFYIMTQDTEDGSESSCVTVDNCKISSNKATTGGAVYIETASRIRIYDTTISGNIAKYDAGIHTEVCGLFKSYITLGGKMIIKGNLSENDGTGLTLDDGFFTKVSIDLSENRPLDSESEIVILSKTDDKTLRITNNSSDNHIGCFEYENGKYSIVAKGSGNSQFLDIKKN